jgi:ketosteroid isomerase-like protein
MSEANKAVALQFIRAMSENDPVSAAECLASDARAVATGNSHFKGARDARMMVDGIEAFKALLPGGLQLTVHSAIAEGDQVAVECEGNATTAAGTRYDNRYVFVFTLRQGKIVLVNEYFCTVLANEVLWPLAQSAAGLGETAA